MFEYEYYGLIILCCYMTPSESVPVFFDPSDCSLVGYSSWGGQIHTYSVYQLMTA